MHHLEEKQSTSTTWVPHRHCTEVVVPARRSPAGLSLLCCLDSDPQVPVKVEATRLLGQAEEEQQQQEGSSGRLLVLAEDHHPRMTCSTTATTAMDLAR